MNITHRLKVHLSVCKIAINLFFYPTMIHNLYVINIKVFYREKKYSDMKMFSFIKHKIYLRCSIDWNINFQNYIDDFKWNKRKFISHDFIDSKYEWFSSKKKIVNIRNEEMSFGTLDEIYYNHIFLLLHLLSLNSQYCTFLLLIPPKPPVFDS